MRMYDRRRFEDVEVKSEIFIGTDKGLKTLELSIRLEW